MRIGAHLCDDDPVGAAERETAVVLFLLAELPNWLPGRQDS